MTDQPLPLEALRTAAPLQHADFAAIRARVLGEIAQREARRWWLLPLRFATAAALVALIVFVSIPSAPPVASPAVVSEAVVPAPVPTAPVVVAQSSTPVVTVRRRSSSVRPRRSAPVRMEIHTADPDVRIIWIINPSSPPMKENS